MSIDICICVHNPMPAIFHLVLTAITKQTLAKDAYRVSVIDNASDPPINQLDLVLLAQSGINYQLLSEPRLGIMYARKLASKSITGDSLIFVDGDNELAPDYLEIAIGILDRYPQIGYFGGRLLSGVTANYPQWMEKLFPYLGIKDYGDTEISNCIQGDYYWGEWEPPTAGAVVRKVVLKRYLETLDQLPLDLVIGRQGSKGLLSCEDSLIAKCSYDLGLQCSYQPALKLNHYVDPDRLQFSYLFKLLFNYGRSYVLLRKAIKQKIEYNTLLEATRTLKWYIKNSISLPYLICLLAKESGILYERWQSKC